MGFSNNYLCRYIDWFHNFNCSLLFGVLFFVFIVIVNLFFNSYYFKSHNIEYQFGEFLCSLLPLFILVFQMFPSLSLLYFSGLSYLDSSLTIKVVGHQWY